MNDTKNRDVKEALWAVHEEAMKAGDLGTAMASLQNIASIEATAYAFNRVQSGPALSGVVAGRIGS